RFRLGRLLVAVPAVAGARLAPLVGHCAGVPDFDGLAAGVAPWRVARVRPAAAALGVDGRGGHDQRRLQLGGDGWRRRPCGAAVLPDAGLDGAARLALTGTTAALDFAFTPGAGDG